jgi:hypothetical protein
MAASVTAATTNATRIAPWRRCLSTAAMARLVSGRLLRPADGVHLAGVFSGDAERASGSGVVAAARVNRSPDFSLAGGDRAGLGGLHGAASIAAAVNLCRTACASFVPQAAVFACRFLRRSARREPPSSPPSSPKSLCRPRFPRSSTVGAGRSRRARSSPSNAGPRGAGRPPGSRPPRPEASKTE